MHHATRRAKQPVTHPASVTIMDGQEVVVITPLRDSVTTARAGAPVIIGTSRPVQLAPTHDGLRTPPTTHTVGVVLDLIHTGLEPTPRVTKTQPAGITTKIPRRLSLMGSHIIINGRI